jgi:divalent metal cation (Fe/Co/Zn/Cd) transporter
MLRVSRIESRMAARLDSRALIVESRETLVCAWLAAALLAGLAANALFGFWWADPLAAMLMVGFIGREGWEALAGSSGPRLEETGQNGVKSSS